jgi:hypothetical protein
MEPLYEEMFYEYFQSLLIRVSQSPQYGSPPSRFPSQSLCKERDAPLPKPSLTCLSQSSVKIPPSRFPLQSPYIEKDVPFPEPSCTYLSKSPAKEPPFQVPIAEFPQKEMLLLQSLLLPVSQSPR